MATRYIYLSHTLNEKLKGEDNASALIVKLLINHYHISEENPDEIKQQLKDLDTKKHEMLAKINETKARFTTNKRVLKQKEIETEEKEHEKAQKTDEKRGRFTEIFTDEVGRLPTDEEWTVFQRLFGNKYSSIHEYLEDVN